MLFQFDLGLWERKSTRPLRAQPAPSLVWKHGITVQIVRRPRARRYLLQLRTHTVARLVIPRGGSQAEALRFLERSEAWLLKRQAKCENQSLIRQPWDDGTEFLFRGERVTLRVETTGDGARLHFAGQVIVSSHAQANYRDVVARHLRRIAERELPARTLELAREHGIAVNRVTVRAQKTRWGSCSARGTISLNWRLIQAPSFVRDYLVIHELMHRREMNHSARYWKLVADACPLYRDAEKWLKKFHLEQIHGSDVDLAKPTT